MINKKIILPIVLSVLIFASTNTSCAATSAKPKQVSPPILRIFYFRDNQKARASLFAHPRSIDVLAPQSYSIDDAGALSGIIKDDILTFAKKHNIKVMPLVTNGSFSKKTAEAILDDMMKQDIAINSLIAEAEKQGYWGWQIDFEGMDASYKDKYSAFVKRMGEAMSAHKIIFSVAVVAQISSNPEDYPNDLWNRIVGAYDYGPLASSADFISVMAYDSPQSTGPVAPYPWLDQVINYSLRSVPANKLSLGIPFYYWKWNDASGKLVDIGGYSGIKNTLKRSHIILGYSKADQAPFIKYAVKKVPYTVWYENSKSIAQKIKLIKQYKLQGFSGWVLGLESPSVYANF